MKVLKSILGIVIGLGSLALAGWGGMSLYRTVNTETSASVPFTKVNAAR